MTFATRSKPTGPCVRRHSTNSLATRYFRKRRGRHGTHLFSKHLGEGQGRAALDLACGTAVISHLLDDLGFKVTGLDWAEPMLERARAKAKARGRQIRFLMGDAERTMEDDAAYDVITNRHLVWTLVDPLACFREWHRVLKPGGKLLIVDGDFVNTSTLTRLLKKLTLLANRIGLARDAQHGAPIPTWRKRTTASCHECIFPKGRTRLRSQNCSRKPLFQGYD